jgi:hypothetical protein
MTTPATTRKAGPFTGTGATGPFPFSFKVFAATDVKVVVADLAGAETVLSSGYTVTLNPDQVASPGGSVTVTAGLTTGFKLTLLGNLPNDQTLALPGGGNYNPVSLENALDRLAMQLQQVAEIAARAVVVTSTSGQDPATILATLLVSSSSAAASAASALASLNSFKSQYYGPLASDPTLDPLGNAVTTGDLYWNTTANELRTYTGAAWVYAPGVPGNGSVTVPKLATDTLTLISDLASNVKAAPYTLALTDRNTSIDTTANVTIPANASVAFPVGTIITVTNTGSGTLTIGITSDTLRQAGTANTGTRTLSAYGMATMRKVSATVWFISGAGMT